MKQIFSLLVLMIGFTATAQVGIGTTDPQATLDVRGTNNGGAVTGEDGILVPRVNDADMSAATAGTEDGQLVYNTNDNTFYFWNAATPAWECLGCGAAATAPTFRRDNTGSVTAADVNNYIVVEANNVYDISAISPNVGDRLNFIDTGTGFSVLGLPAGQTVAPPANGGGMILIYDGTEWLTLTGF